MKKIIMLIIVVFLTLLVACNNEEESTEGETDEFVSPEQFIDEFLEGEFEKLYKQLSDSFQQQVSLEEFEGLGQDFNEGVQSYEVMSVTPIRGLTEYQWISNEGNQGIRGHFADDDTIEGLQLTPLSTFPESDDTYTENTYHMPVVGEWLVFWGGTNELVNYHYASEVQRYAYDLLIYENDSSFDGDPEDNESYYAFGQDVVAPLDGTVVSIENNIHDNTPGIETNEEQPLGNHIIIEHDHNEYSVMGHLQESSVQVSEGDEVNTGDVIAAVGNSGNSSEPHMHFQVSDDLDWLEGSSIRIQLENGEEPIRGDRVNGF
ncbi:M23 family metallopeptidase [Alkalibacillus haloalkaliphilus]|uniref:M23 family metallopeptidase n=1 Tax=Alkalibacillus haloalkaliphilus TaxID=94136 RepID=UPI0003121CF7|nr:M23 family metallopeptidase [Alkalibacillus haloalkaliphilus]